MTRRFWLKLSSLFPLACGLRAPLARGSAPTQLPSNLPPYPPMKNVSENPLRNRADLQSLVRDLVQPLAEHFSPGCAQVHLGENRALFGDPAGWLEGFARPLWGLVPLSVGGGGFPLSEKWRQGLENGAHPGHPEYWGLAGDFDQRSVEQAAIGFALAEAPEVLWDPLSAAAKQNLAAWLYNINRVKLVDSNWLFFRVIVNLGLRARGQAWSADQMKIDLDRLEQFHLGGGWYSDGAGGSHHRDGRTGDYYVSMGFQYYSLLYVRLAADLDPERCRRFIERAKAFARDFQYYFAENGAALPFGRSLTYRFAQGAYWGALAFANVEALPWGVIKGLYLRHLRWWMREPIFSPEGLLTVGYTYPNYIMAESYNSPQSPYWSFKAFVPLALPADHPFWTAEEAPLPPRSRVHTIAGAKLIIATDANDRQIVAINPGQSVLDWPRHAPHKYSKCSYSTRYGFAVATSSATPAEGGLDSSVSLSDDGRFFRTREQCFESAVQDGVAYSVWRPWSDVELRLWILAEGEGHIRIGRLETARKIWSVDAGFALVYTDPQTRHFQADSRDGPTVRTPEGRSTVTDLFGQRTGECVDLGANSHLLKSLSAMPLLRGEHAAGIHWFASWVQACPDAVNANAAPLVSSYQVKISGSDITVLRDQAPWWGGGDAGGGTSSAERLRYIDQKV